jgi:hypothetical protein
MAFGLQKSISLIASLTLWLALISMGRMQAQNPPMKLLIGMQQSSNHSVKANRPNRVLPDHVIQNPQGYSPLCRMELKIERQSPVGIWFKIDGNRLGSVANPGLASLRFKVPIPSR